MNTPRSKKPKRYPPSKSKRTPIPTGGSYESGVTDSKMKKLLGELASYWPHVEDAMVHFFHELLGAQRFIPSRQLYKSIVNTQIRIGIMRTLLERTPLNKTRSDKYDEVIDEFASLNGQRNTYLHGLWYTYEDGRTFFCELAIDEDHFLDQREIKHKEIENVINRMRSLQATIKMKQYLRP